MNFFLGFIIALLVALVIGQFYFLYVIVEAKKQLKVEYENADVRAVFWANKYRNLLSGPDGAWARAQNEQIKALEQGLDEAVDDHAQEQASWEESRGQYWTTIADLEDQLHAKEQELRDVQETALQMQIDLNAKE